MKNGSQWMIVNQDQVPIYFSPSNKAHFQRICQDSVPIEVVGGVGKWYKVKTAFDETGYVHRRHLDTVSLATRMISIQQKALLLARPHAEALTISSLESGEEYAILGKESDYYWIENSSGQRGWLATHSN